MQGVADMLGTSQSQELRRNYDVFREILPTILPTHQGKYALMRHGIIVAYFDNLREAILSGRSQYKDRVFSVQEVTDRKADFGWFSRANGNTSI